MSAISGLWLPWRSAVPAVEIVAGPGARGWMVLAGATLTAAASVALTADGVFGVIVLGACALGMLLRPRGILPATWLALLGLWVLRTDVHGVGLGQVAWVVALVLAVHVTLTLVRLLENLDVGAHVTLAVLRGRFSTFWRAQLVAQLLGVTAWWPSAGGAPWLTVVAGAGVCALAVLVLTRWR